MTRLEFPPCDAWHDDNVSETTILTIDLHRPGEAVVIDFAPGATRGPARSRFTGRRKPSVTQDSSFGRFSSIFIRPPIIHSTSSNCPAILTSRPQSRVPDSTYHACSMFASRGARLLIHPLPPSFFGLPDHLSHHPSQFLPGMLYSVRV